MKTKRNYHSAKKLELVRLSKKPVLGILLTSTRLFACKRCENFCEKKLHMKFLIEHHTKNKRPSALEEALMARLRESLNLQNWARKTRSNRGCVQTLLDSVVTKTLFWEANKRTECKKANNRSFRLTLKQNCTFWKQFPKKNEKISKNSTIFGWFSWN